MDILGISCHFHDAAAALVRDGLPVAAIEEERLSRRKHDAGFPAGAVRAVLEWGGIGPRDLAAAVFYEKPIRKFDRLLTSCVATWPRSLAAFVRGVPPMLREKLWIGERIHEELGDAVPVLYCVHHMAHAASAWFPSPFDRAGVLTVDGVGEWTSTTFGIGEGDRLSLEGRISFPHSLGLFYSAVTAYLGFRVNNDEWKVMGLASYGRPRYMEQMERLVRLAPDGSFRLDLDWFAHPWSSRRMHHRWEKLFGLPPRRPEADLEEFHQDVAASGQAMVERAMVGLAGAVADRYGVNRLCVAGGVGLNGVANWKILEETPIEEIFVQPAAGDDGGALGAALWAWHVVHGGRRRWGMRDAYLGPAHGALRCRRALEEAGLPHRRLERDELLAAAAGWIAEGRVVGWYQGRMEFGPRALGDRSILADPRDAGMKAKINAKVKFREAFRPFAPVVVREEADAWFELGGREAPYMLLVPPVVAERRERIPAVTHIDGTGRVQTIERDQNPLYYDLVRAFEQRTGVPILLNTSFNVKGEPIVETPRDAVACFLGSGIDALVLGPYLVEKPEGAAGS